MGGLHVADLMTRDVAVIDGKSDIEQLEQLLLSRRVHGVPVVDDDGALVGVVSQTDLLAWHYNTGVGGAAFYDYSNLILRGDEEFKSLEFGETQRAPVREVMSDRVLCVTPDEPIAAAARKMIEQRVHRLIVVDAERRVVGILAALDLLRAIPGVPG